MAEARPAKRARLLSEDEDDSDNPHDGVQLPTNSGPGEFKINAEYAKRFEHNKKREELQRLEEKYKNSNKRTRGDEDDEDEDDSEMEDSDSESESEDDAAELATVEVDREIMDTLNAIRSKDPRVYDKEVKFYKDFDPDTETANGPVARKEKPMYLQDYHRQNLLSGNGVADDEETEQTIPTYQQEQDALKREVVDFVHADQDDDDAESDDDGFLVKKAVPTHDAMTGVVEAKPAKAPELDVSGADRDPETFLSNFMAARAWLPTEKSRFTALDSDDSSDEERADAFEEAHNMRFENPALANEKLKIYSRDVAQYSVRREEKSKRKKTRDTEREKKEAIKRERDEEKARLRKLKIEDAEEKVNRIKEAAGLAGQDVDLTQWRGIIEGDFDDAEWDQEMTRRFGDKYYNDREGKAKKPTWDDDIDIKDLVPDFEEDQDISMSDSEGLLGGAPLPAEDEDADPEAEESTKKKKKTKKDREKDKADARKVARKQRQQIESMVDDSLATEMLPSTSKKGAPGFRYRETSPTSFGLTSRDILFADDKQLNEYAGLKKLAAFRDESKKRKDKTKYGKKARLREWRKDTFGNPKGPPEPEVAAKHAANGDSAVNGEEKTKKKKKRRQKKQKTESVDA